MPEDGPEIRIDEKSYPGRVRPSKKVKKIEKVPKTPPVTRERGSGTKTEKKPRRHEPDKVKISDEGREKLARERLVKVLDKIAAMKEKAAGQKLEKLKKLREIERLRKRKPRR